MKIKAKIRRVTGLVTPVWQALKIIFRKNSMGRKEDVAAAVVEKLTKKHGFYVHETDSRCVLKDIAN
jgi:hypothetical protein